MPHASREAHRRRVHTRIRFLARARGGNRPSLLRALELAVVDGLLQGHRLHALDRAADGVAGPEDLLHGARELLGEALVAHLAGDVEDGRLRQVAAVLDVLGLLAVAERLLKGLNDERGGVRLDVDLGRTVLDGELHGHADALPGAGALDDVVADLLRGHAQGPDLGGEHGRRGLLAAILAQLHDLHLVGVELRGHGFLKSSGRPKTRLGFLRVRP
mmetsp:Transcript_31624/g.93916  ORF Transcript_31624/g.93916 Transcript_31624/m.93916 type:complete len:216 (-) Transcript_31624:8-655(-)